ncbi:hypothetical protein [Phycicoccus flavus]|uniref:hypothetical protein n=1 Tax=Phycicoccus flavus TaxID=2502783 RepID=UPI000FEBFFF8|nr:hypothetical protein [Phycicoccus flavus]NHA67829.1 hypothetical protein [Phycicoccus flavus]
MTGEVRNGPGRSSRSTSRLPVPREQAGTVVLVFATACAVTVMATRAYLTLTGFPQIGGEVYHLAHALWGGVLLTVAVVLAAGLSDTWVPPAAGALGGVGAGLFVDEVGKFITQTNDYFFPLAATIVYLFLVLLAGATFALSRYRRDTAEAHLYVVLDLAAAAADDRLTTQRHLRLLHHLDRARECDPDEQQRRIIDAMASAFATERALAEQHGSSRWDRLATRLGPTVTRRLARAVLLLHAFGAVTAIVTLVALPFLPPELRTVDLVTASGDTYELGGFGFRVAVASTVAGAVGGVLALVAVVLMSPSRRRVRPATVWGVAGMAVLLGVADPLASYTSQFSVFLASTAQALALLALLLWNRAERVAVEASEREDALASVDAPGPGPRGGGRP